MSVQNGGLSQIIQCWKWKVQNIVPNWHKKHSFSKPLKIVPNSVIATYISDTNVLILFLTKKKGIFLSLERIQSQAFKPDNLIRSYY